MKELSKEYIALLQRLLANYPYKQIKIQSILFKHVIDEIERLQAENDRLKSDAEQNELILLALHEALQEKQEHVQDLEQERRWIPISERLPEMNKTVLVVCGSVTIAKRKVDIIKNYCWVEIDGMELKHVTHWQSLPQLPQEEE